MARYLSRRLGVKLQFVPVTAANVALIVTVPPGEYTDSGLVWESELPFTVEDWNSYSLPPIDCGSVKATEQ